MASPRLKQVIAAVAAARGVKVDELVGPRRPRRIVEPRQEAMWLARQVTGLSLPQIGAAFGGRDHTTVMASVRVVDQRRAQDIRLAGRLDRMRAQLEGAPA